MWPRDSLAADVPELDIWTYGYSSGVKWKSHSVAEGKSHSVAAVEDHAITFISLLRDLRNTARASWSFVRFCALLSRDSLGPECEADNLRCTQSGWAYSKAGHYIFLFCSWATC